MTDNLLNWHFSCKRCLNMLLLCVSIYSLTLSGALAQTTSLTVDPDWTNDSDWSGTAPSYITTQDLILDHNSTISTDLEVFHVVTINSGVTLATDQKIIIQAGGHLIINGTVSLTQEVFEVKVGGQVTINGRLEGTATNSSELKILNTTLTSNSGAVIDWNGDWNSNDSPATITLDGNVFVGGDFNNSANTITLNGNLFVGGSYNNTGSVVGPGAVNSLGALFVLNAVSIDLDADGVLDALEIEFTTPVDDSDFTAAVLSDWEVSDFSFPTHDNITSFETEVEVLATANTVDDEYIRLRFTPGNISTGTAAINFRYTKNSALDIEDAGSTNILAAFGETNAIDKAPPAITTLIIDDTDGDGKIDDIDLVFSEPVDNVGGGTPIWSDFGTINLPDGSIADLISAPVPTITDPNLISNTINISGNLRQNTENTALGLTGIDGVTDFWIDAAGNRTVDPDENEVVIDQASPYVTSVIHDCNYCLNASCGGDLILQEIRNNCENGQNIVIEVDAGETGLNVDLDLTFLNPGFSNAQPMTEIGGGIYRYTTVSVANMNEGVGVDIPITATDIYGNAKLITDSVALNIDNQAPEADNLVVPSLLTGASGPFTFDITFNKEIAAGDEPVLTFPAEDPTPYITINNTNRLDEFTFEIEAELVPAVEAELANIDVTISGVADQFQNAIIPQLFPDHFSIDTKPAVISSHTTEVSQDVLTLTVELDEAGTLYYQLLSSGNPAPVATDIRDNPGGAIGGSIAIPVSGTPFIELVSLDPASDYDLYLVAVDENGNLQQDADITQVLGLKTGGVSITAPTLVGLCADAGNVMSLGDIVLTERIPSDFEIGAAQTLLLSLPTNFIFNTAATASVNFSGSSDVTTSSITYVGQNAIRVTYTVVAEGELNAMTISGLELTYEGTSLVSNQPMLRTGGTANIYQNAEVDGNVHATLSVNFVAPPTPTIALASQTNLCVGSGFTITAEGTSAMPTFTWYDDTQAVVHTGTVTNETLMTGVVDINTPGDYTIYLSETSGDGCTSGLREIIVSVKDEITGLAIERLDDANVLLASSDDVCEGDGPVNYFVADIPGSTYTWSTGGGVIASGNGTSNILVNWTTGGVHTLSVTVNNPDRCAAAIASIGVNVKATPTADLTLNPPLSSFTTSAPLVDLIVPVEGMDESGVLAGPSVIGSQFDPGDAGPGVFTLTYKLTNTTTGCFHVDSVEVTVVAANVVIPELSAQECIRPNPDNAGQRIAITVTGDFQGETLDYIDGHGIVEDPPASGNWFFDTQQALTDNGGYGAITIDIYRTNQAAIYATQSVELLELPDVTFTMDEAAYCTDAGPITLVDPFPATPGVFSGNGVFPSGGDFVFNPIAAYLAQGGDFTNPQDVTITYTSATLANGCRNTSTNVVAVNPVAMVSMQAYETATPANTVTSGSTFCNDEDYWITIEGSPAPGGANTGTFVITPAGTMVNPGDGTAQFNPKEAHEDAVSLGLISSTDDLYIEIYYTYTEDFQPANTGTCTQSVAAYNFTVYPDPQLSFSSAPATREFCFDDISNVEFEIATTSGGGVFSVNSSPGLSISGNTVTLVPNTFALDQGQTQFGPSTDYSMVIDYVDLQGCTAQLIETFTINPLPAVSVIGFGGDTDFCYDDGDVLLTGSPTPIPGSTGVFSIDTGTGLGLVGDLTSGTVAFRPSAAHMDDGGTQFGGGPTTHDITYTYTTAEGCVNQQVITVTVNPQPNVSANLIATGPICFDDNVINLQGLVDGLPAGAGVWSSDNGGVTSFGDGTGEFNPALAAVNAGSNFAGWDPPLGTDHVVTFEYTDANGCTFTYTENIHIGSDPDPFIDKLQSQYCEDADDVLIEGILQDSSIPWLFGFFELFDINDPVNPLAFGLDPAGFNTARLQPRLLSRQEYIVRFTWLSTDGCLTSVEETIEIVEASNPTITNLPVSFCDEVNPIVELIGNPVPLNVDETALFTLYTSDTLPILDPTILTAGGILRPGKLDPGTYLVGYTFDDGGVCNNIGYSQFEIRDSQEVPFTTLNTQYCIDDGVVALVGDIAPDSVTTFGRFLVDGVVPGENILSDNGYGSATLDLRQAAQLKGTSEDGDPPATIDVSYEFTDIFGCTGTSTQTIAIYPNPSVDFTFTADRLCIDANAITLAGTPSGGTFAGTGIVGSGSTVTFDPLVAANDVGITDNVSNHLITYTYTSAQGCVTVKSEVFTVTPIPEVNFKLGPGDNDSSLETLEICAINPDGTDNIIRLEGEPETTIGTNSLWTGDGINQGPLGLADFNAAEAQQLRNGGDPLAETTHVIRYTHTDVEGCDDFKEKTIIVIPAPIAAFEASGGCQDQVIDFTDLSQSSVSDNLIDWYWELTFLGGNTDAGVAIGTVTNIATDQHPSILVEEPGLYEVALVVTSAKSCVSTSSRDTINVGNIPDPSFTWTGVCESTTTVFDGSPTPDEFDRAGKYVWDYGDGSPTDTIHIDQGESLLPQAHLYDSSGSYVVTFTLITTTGCTKSYVENIFILPLQTLTEGDPYFEDFETTNGGWVADTRPLDPDNPDEPRTNSWQWGESGAGTTRGVSNQWGTFVSGGYQTAEQSWILSPCFDLSNLSRPMIRFDRSFRFGDRRDGVVLQYSIDDGTTWEVVGSFNGEESTGVDWYTHEGIAGDPGGQDAQAEPRVGWAGNIDTNFEQIVNEGEARHKLDEIPQNGRSAVRFRFALGANADERRGEGFELDNVWIGNREKLVLLEQFSSTFSEESRFANDTIVNRFTDPILNNNDAIFINYHTDIDGNDPLFLSNKQDPGARRLFYGVDRVPASVLDGTLEEDMGEQSALLWTRNDLNISSLMDPAFDIDIILDTDNAPDDELWVGVDITARSDIESTNLLVHIMAIETGVVVPSAQNGQAIFRNVLRRSINDGSGDFFGNTTLSQGDGLNIAQQRWPIKGIDNPDSLALVVFIQNFNTKEVYQAAYLKVDGRSVVTSIGNQLETIQLDLYPNPAQTSLEVSFGTALKKDYDWRLYNQLGVAIEEGMVFRGSTQFRIDVSNLPNGLFYLMVENEEHTFKYKKVLIMH